jgi:hypothetical protein
VDRSLSGSGQTEIFFAPEGDSHDRPTLVFQHINKTGGTSLRGVIRKSLAAHERVVGKVKHVKDRGRQELLDEHRALYESFEPERKASLSCVMSHTGAYFLPFIERPVQAIAVVRDPVDRVMSQYYRRDREKSFDPTGSPLAESYKRSEDPMSLGDIFANLSGASPADSLLAGRYDRFFNGESRCLLDPHYDTAELAYSEGAPPDADVWRERLFSLVSERYLIGLQERLDDFFAELAGLFGWKARPVIHRKVGKHRPALEEMPVDAAETIRAFNWLDDELHRFGTERFAERRAGVSA